MINLRGSSQFLFLLICLSVSPLAQAPSKTAPTGTSTVTGRVLLKGEPARGVALALLSQSGAGIVNAAPIPRARSDENGRFRFTAVAAGRYSLQAIAPGYIGLGEQQFSQKGKTLIIADGENLENIDIELRRGGVIAGHITDSKGQPLIEERITLNPLDSNGKPQEYVFWSGSYEMYQTDDHGNYRIFGLPEGRYIVSVGVASEEGTISGSGGRYVYPRTYHPDVIEKAQAKAIEVTEGSEATDVDIVVGEPIRTYDILGRVVYGETGQPVAGLEIGYGTLATGRNAIGSSGFFGERSNSNGEFRLRGISPGRYAVFVRPISDSDFYSDPTICEIRNADVQGIEVRVYLGGTISGVVVVDGTNDPSVLSKLSQLQLSCYFRESSRLNAPGKGGIKVDSYGSFRIRGVPPGLAQLSLVPYPNARSFIQLRLEQNGVPQRDGIEVKAGAQVTGVRIVLSYSSLFIRGEVKIVGSALPPNHRLYINVHRVDQTSRTATGAEVDARGQFIIEPLSPGEYELTVYPSFFPNIPQPDPQIFRAFTAVKEKVVLRDANHPPVILTVDLSPKEKEQ